MPAIGLPGTLGEEVCQLGQKAGLDAVGVCDARPFEEALAALNSGLSHGWDAGMQFTYRNPARSTDPSRTVKGAIAMVAGALRYDRASPDADETTRIRPRGVVARYAWEDHYAKLRASLEQVAQHLRLRGWQAAVLVDDNSLVDRAAAVRAGLGWYGKNTNVLIPDAGSWFVLGSVVTDAPLLASISNSGERFDPGTPQIVDRNAKHVPARNRRGAEGHPTGPERAPKGPEHEPIKPLTLTPGSVEDGCGTCRRCIDACPTGALTEDEPGHLDAGKCLAWLVQAPGVFPREYRVALHDRMYGCDDCQEVCPVNRLAERRYPAPPPEPGATTTVDVLDVLDASDAELLHSLGRWYIPNRDPTYVRRNALVVLGNIGDPASTDTRKAIHKAVTDTDPIIRSHAVWAAARLGYTDLIPGRDRAKIVQAEIEAAPSVPSRTTPVGAGLA